MNTWGSQKAEDTYRIAVRLAGFDPKELMMEINRRQRDRSRRVNVTTVLKAMQTIFERRRG